MNLTRRDCLLAGASATLLAWLGIQLRRAEAAGEVQAAQALRLRIGLVESSVAGSAKSNP